MGKFNYYKSIEEYNEIYQKEISPILSQYEPQRLELLKQKKATTLSLYLSSVLFMLSCFSSFIFVILVGSLALAFFIAMICIIIFYVKLIKSSENKKEYTIKEQQFLDEIKTKYFNKILKVFGSIDWQAGGECVIPREEIEKSTLNSYYRRNYKTSEIICDQFIGEYKNVEFKVSEINNVNDSGLTFYRGIYIYLPSNKKTNSPTVYEDKTINIDKISFYIVLIIIGIFLLLVEIINGYYEIRKSNPDLYSIVPFGTAGIMCIILGICSINIQKNNKMNLEDVKSEKKYVALSNDQIEGRYLLTPAFIERFNGLKTLFKASKISCAFFEDKLMIAINTKKNLFELGSIDKSFNDPSVLQDFFNEIYSIYGIIDALKLDEKTGL